MEKYILILWPESQDYMEEKWFREEAILHQASDEQEHIDSAYFIPAHRVDNEVIKTKKQEKYCPKCDGKLETEKEKEIDYPYVCKSCDENFYEFETIEFEQDYCYSIRDVKT